jgi:hypothetical protein
VRWYRPICMLFLLVSIACLYVVVKGVIDRHRPSALLSDGELRKIFEDHRDEFVKLRDQIVADSDFHLVGEDYVVFKKRVNDSGPEYRRNRDRWSPSSSSERITLDAMLSRHGASKDDYQAYVDSLAKLGVQRLTNDRGATEFRMSIVYGNMVGSITKLVVHLPNGLPPNSKERATTDDVRQNGLSYVHLQGDWYIRCDRW